MQYFHVSCLSFFSFLSSKEVFLAIHALSLKMAISIYNEVKYSKGTLTHNKISLALCFVEQSVYHNEVYKDKFKEALSYFTV